MAFARTKIQRPIRRPGALLDRPTLQQRLGEALLTRRLVLLCAAAGFGKTSALTRQCELLPQYLNKFREMTDSYQQQTFINPVLSVLEIASRRELAETAQELILLNAFKKRIMAQKQTVGGAIDVAVISRDTGFQWHARQDGERVYG